MVDEKNNSEMLTEAEAELYDRQIRLWGLDSQKRLRSAKILLIGLNGFGAEVAKNIILSGVKSVTFLDHRNISVEDTCSQFFISKDALKDSQNSLWITPRATASLKRAQKLNPMVDVIADDSHVDSKSDAFYANYDVVCASECTITQIVKINAACRKHNVKFFAGDVWGTFGFTFADLNVHEFAQDVVQTKKKEQPAGGEPVNIKENFENTVNTIKKTAKFVPFEQTLNIKNLPKGSEVYYLLQFMLNYREEHGRDPLPSERDNGDFNKEAAAFLAKNNLDETVDNLLKGDLYGQVSPVCAILGGVMGQEIIKAVSQKEAPHNNTFLFNPETLCGKIFRLCD